MQEAVDGGRSKLFGSFKKKNPVSVPLEILSENIHIEWPIINKNSPLERTLFLC